MLSEQKHRYDQTYWSTVVILAVSSTIAYKEVINGPFLFDDIPAIVKNPDVQGNTPLSVLLKNDFWGTPLLSNSSHKSYRPVTVLTFRIINLFCGNCSKSYHIFNITVHIIVSVLVVLVSSKHVFDDNRRNSQLAGLLFSLHPIHTEAVCGIVGCAELLSALFFMLTVLTYKFDTSKPLSNLTSTLEKQTEVTPASIKPHQKILGENNMVLRQRHNENNSREIHPNLETFNLSSPMQDREKKNFISNDGTRKIFVYLFLVPAAMLSKESGIAVLAVLVTCEILQTTYKNKHEKKFLIRLMMLFEKIAILLILGVVLITFRLWIMGWSQPIFAEPDNPVSFKKERLTRALTYISLCWVNLLLLLFPVNLCYDYSYGTIPIVTSFFCLRNLISMTFLFMWLMFGYVLVMKVKHQMKAAKPWIMGCALMIFPFLPASNLFFPVGFVVAERVLYLPSVGFIIILIALWSKGLEIFPSKKWWFYLAMIGITIAYFWITMTRTRDWTSKEAFLRSGLTVAPHNAKIRYNWANFLRETNRLDEAVAEYETTLELFPKYVSAIHNLATILEENKKSVHKAEELYAQAIRLQPWHENSYLNLANLFTKQGKYEQAAKVLIRAIQIMPGHVMHAVSLARVFSAQKKYNQAKRTFQHLLNRTCLENDLNPKTCTWKHQTAINNYAEFLANTGEVKQSINLLSRNVEINSSNSDAMVQLSNIWLANGKPKYAAIAMLRSVEIDYHQVHNLWRLASDLFQQKLFTMSASLYERVAKLMPDNFEALGQYAAVLWEKGERSRAEDFLLNITLRDHYCIGDSAWRNLAAIYGRQRRHEEAIVILRNCFDRLRKVKHVNDSLRKARLLCAIAKHERDRSKELLAIGETKQANMLWKRSLQNLEEAVRLDDSYQEPKQILQHMQRK